MSRKCMCKKQQVTVFVVLFASLSVLSSFVSITNATTFVEPPYQYSNNPNGNDWWSMFRHDAMHSGVSTTTAPDTAEVLWSYQTDFIISSSPAISHGRVYIGSWDRSIYCLDMDSGALLWNYSTSSEITSSPTVANGKVYVGSQDTYLYCLDAIDGSLLWDFKTGFMVETSPTVVDETVIFGSSDGSLYCLNTQDGALVWEYETNSAFVSSTAVVGEKLYVGIVNGNFICLNSITGEHLWTFTTTSGIYSSPTFDEGRIFFGANDNNVYCLDAENGSLLWSYYTQSEVHSSPSIAYGLLYIGTSDGRLLCLDKETGDFLWSYVINGSVESSPGVADGKVYFVTDPCCGYTSYLFCLNAYTGSLIWNYNLNTQLHTKSSPALAAGKLVVGSGDGIVYAFGEIQYLADANGPYYGFVNSSVQFTGSVYGGEPGFSWYWDLGDGMTSTLQNPTHTYSSLGEFVVTLTVTDSLGHISTDETFVFIDVPNVPPEIPIISGPTTGKPAESYEFDFTSSDQNGDKIMYYIDWGDNTTTEWIGPFLSGVIVHQEHTWSTRGSYNIKAKVKDWHGAESSWSELFELSIIAPELIVEIKGGFGVTVTISNTGDAVATALTWNITIDNGLILNSYRLQFVFDLQPGVEFTEKVYVLGFGKSTLHLSASCDEGVSVNNTIQAKLFLFFVFGVK
ncbi:MAG TPA: PQQ-binding-like beta-propeller repeat protein [Candidatus Thermoplasmatota archaeon]|nr:PQQ-binding-like beta-propeller repeat protein [Candidatus Thermoplasmatota archaeon]